MLREVGDGEMVGLHAISNGRSCSSHACCGAYISGNDLVRFKLVIIDYNGQSQEAIACHRIQNGAETCLVGFLPRNIVARSRGRFVDKIAEVLEIYDQYSNIVKRKKSYRNKGMASFRLL